MELTVNYLTKHPEILEIVKQGMASLLGVTREEEKAIIKSFNEINIPTYFWY